MKGTVIVTGGSGFLGKRISRRLRNEGFKVYQMAQPSENVEGKWVFKGDITDPDSFAFPPADILVHCAGILESSHPKDEVMYNVNFKGTKYVYQKGKDNGIKRFIMISTISAMGPQGKKNRPMDESTPERPEDTYGDSKRKAEEYLISSSKAESIDLVILRPTVLYGEGMNIYSSGMKTFTSIKRGIMPIVGKGDTIFNLLYVDNFVDAVVLSCLKGKGQETYIVSEGPYTLKEVVETIESKLGRKGHIRIPRSFLYFLARTFQILSPIIKGPPPISMTKYRALTSDVWHVKADKIKKKLGWAPSISLSDGASRTIDYYDLRD